MEIITLKLEKQHVDVILEALACAWHVQDKRYARVTSAIREQLTQ